MSCYLGKGFGGEGKRPATTRRRLLNTVAAAADSEASADEFDMENHMHIVVLVAAIAHTSSTSSAFPKA